MRLRETPETDAFIEALNDYAEVEFAQLTAHARKLERERDASLEALRELQEAAQ